MKKTMKIISVIIAFVMAFTLLSGCEKKSSGGDLVIGTTAEILSANRKEYNFDVLSGTLAQAGLVKQDEKGNFLPRLATFSTTDSKVWTFKLIEGAKWSDGTALTADDVLFTMEYLEMTNGGGYRADYEDIRVISDDEIEFVAKEPNVRLLSSLTAIRIIPKHIYEGTLSMAEVENDKANIGVGPYKYDSFDADSGAIIFTKNELSNFGEGRADRVIFKTFSSQDAMYLALKKGDIDMVYVYASGIESAAYDSLKESENLGFQEITDLSNPAALVFNNNRAPFDDVNFRKGIMYSIDYEKFRALFGTEYTTPARENFVPNGTFGLVEMKENERDLKKAKEYFEKAGYVDSDGDGILDKAGKKATLNLLIRSDKTVFLRYGELLQTNLKEVGVDVKILLKEVSEYRELTEKSRNFDFTITKFTAYGMSMQGGLGTAYLDPRSATAGQGQVFDEEFLAIVDGLKSSVSLEEYKEYAKKCQEFYRDQTPSIALFWDSYIQAFDKKLQGFSIDGTFGLLNFETFTKLEGVSN